MSPYTKKLNNKKITLSVSAIDWEFSTANTATLTHEIHRYSGKYIPQIAKSAIELISFPGETILDPYVGSGTTLLEANLASRHSIGVDLNPLAVLISQVKTTPVEEIRLKSLFAHFQNLVNSLINSERGLQSLFGGDTTYKEIKLRAQNDPRRNDTWYNKWFSKKTLDNLLIIDHALRSYKDKDSAALARVAFSNILRRSSNAHSGYPNVMFDKRKNNQIVPTRLFIKSLSNIITSVRELNTKFDKRFRVEVLYGDATQLPFEDNSIDAIVTHPPYIGSVPYAEYGVLSLKWLGYEPKEVDEKLTGGRRQSKNVVAKFTDGYKKMLLESFRVLKEGRYMFILIGDPTVKGEKVDLAKLTRDLSKDVGFRLIAEKKRNGINRRANKMGAETLFFFQK